uniref:Uncharacterized protein n=1 Tax=Anguilla anguilla TaxID=7936 RepID=A0A0E9WKP9_ANGAN
MRYFCLKKAMTDYITSFYLPKYSLNYIQYQADQKLGFFKLRYCYGALIFGQ